MQCPNWLNLSAGLPKQPTSDAAKQGTALHSIFEALVGGDRKKPHDFIGETVEGVEITAHHIEQFIIPGMDAFEKVANALRIAWGVPEVECGVSADTGGWADYVGQTVNGELVVLDWKTGNKQVMPEAPSLVFYGMCCERFSSVKKRLKPITGFHAVIIQPNTLGLPVGRIKTYTQEEYLEAKTDIRRAIRASQEPTPPTRAGDECHFCPALSTCPERLNIARRAMTMDLKDRESLAEAADMLRGIRAWEKAVTAEAKRQILECDGLPGLKMVEHSRVKKWRDPDAALRYLMPRLRKKRVAPPTLLSPAKVRALAKKHGVKLNDLDRFIKTETGSMSIVRESDPRPAVITEKALADSLKELENQ